MCKNQKNQSTWWYGETGDVMTKGLAQWKGVTKKKEMYWLVSEDLSSQGKDLQPEILLQQQSALKWGLREVQPGSTPSSHTGELPSSVLPRESELISSLRDSFFQDLFKASWKSESGETYLKFARAVLSQALWELLVKSKLLLNT